MPTPFKVHLARSKINQATKYLYIQCVQISDQHDLPLVLERKKGFPISTNSFSQYRLK